MRKSIISLFAVECHKDRVQEMLVEMRRALYALRTDTLTDEHMRAVGERALARFTDFQGIEAIYIAAADNTIDLAFLLEDSADASSPTAMH